MKGGRINRDFYVWGAREFEEATRLGEGESRILI